MIDALLYTTVHIATFYGRQGLTNATGFLFERDGRLFLVTSRHVLVDEPSGHHPDRIDIELHTDTDNLAESVWYGIPLYRYGKSLWKQGEDSAGAIDVAVIEIERHALPATAVFQAFRPEHLPRSNVAIEIGSQLLIVGFPLGFHDELHHMPVARHAILASAFGLRFKGQGYFLTDARTHRGTSGSPVVMKRSNGDLPWTLLGVHSSRLDVGHRDQLQDEALGLNCAWYADILMVLTAT